MRKLCWFVLPFCAAILAVCLGLPALLPIGLAFAALGILTGFLKQRPICLACLGLAAGLLWFQCCTCVLRAPAQALAGKPFSFTARVLDFPKETANGRYGVEVRLHLDGMLDPKALLYVNEPGGELLPGDVITGTATFLSPNSGLNERVAYYESEGIFLRSSSAELLLVEHPDRPPAAVWPVYWAQAMKQSICEIFPGDVSGLMIALLTGDKSSLSDSTYASLQRSGAAHIVAVSGLHLSFFAGFLALFFRRNSRLGAMLTILLVFLYAAVAGFSPSVTRAAFMISMTLLAPLFHREEDRLTTLSVILFLLLLFNPYAIQSVSLQLSFASVMGIHLISKPLYRAMTHAQTEGASPLRKLCHRLFRVFAANVSVTLGALLLTTPLTAWHFGSVSIISPITNLLVLWAVSLAFAPGLVLTLLGIALPGLAALLTFPVTLLTRYILTATRVLGSLSFASLSMDSAFLCLWLVLVYCIVILVLLRRYRRPIFPVSLCAITLCIAILLTRFSILSPPLSITMLDVGQGQCILVCSGGRTALIDCGGSTDNAGDIAADYLQSLGISRLDLLILTHCHDDHANGVPELFSRVEVSSLVLPDLSRDESTYRSEILSLAEKENTEITLLNRNHTATLGESTLTLYAPLGAGDSNEEGLFVLVACDGFDLLVTGDADSFVESLLMKYNYLPDIEVLVAGHHGSGNSTSETLLDHTTPEVCLISVGYNTYGHPTEETMSRLESRGINIYRTDQHGHVTIRYKGE